MNKLSYYYVWLNIYKTIVYIFMDLVEGISRIIDIIIVDCLCLNIKTKNVIRFLLIYFFNLCSLNVLNICYNVYMI